MPGKHGILEVECDILQWGDFGAMHAGQDLDTQQYLVTSCAVAGAPTVDRQPSSLLLLATSLLQRLTDGTVYDDHCTVPCIMLRTSCGGLGRIACTDPRYCLVVYVFSRLAVWSPSRLLINHKVKQNHL
jgi:hypothetical protein